MVQPDTEILKTSEVTPQRQIFPTAGKRKVVVLDDDDVTLIPHKGVYTRMTVGQFGDITNTFLKRGTFLELNNDAWITVLNFGRRAPTHNSRANVTVKDRS